MRFPSISFADRSIKILGEGIPTMARRDSAFAVICRRKQVLLVKSHDENHWQLPGGGVKSRETPWSAVLREVREETGLEARLLALTGIYRRRDGSLAFVF